MTRARPLIGGSEVVEVLLEGLVVLPLDLQLGLELPDEELETRDFRAQLQHIVACGPTRWSRAMRCGQARCGEWLGGRCGGRSRWRARRREGFGQCARPNGFRRVQ